MAFGLVGSQWRQNIGKSFSAYINGQWVKSINGRVFDVQNPANGSLVGQVPCMEATDAEEAIRAAYTAQPSWSSRTAKERASVLKQWHKLMIKHSDDLAEVMTLESGKPLAESKGEVVYAASFVEWFAEEAKRAYGQTIPTPSKRMRTLTVTEPVGVCGMVTPWNFPAAMITRKVAPALAAGCAAVVKPSEETPLSALALVELAHLAGVPAGLFNVVTAERGEKGAASVGWELCSHPHVRKISFTGSTEVGKLLMELSASTVKRLSLELGGNAPFVVFEDADLDMAVNAAMTCKFRNAGQTCISANRFIIHENIAGAFQDRMLHAMKRKLKVGNGMDRGITLGPLINSKAIKKMQRHVRDAKAKGAEILIGGGQPTLAEETGGHFFEPTLICNIQDDMLVWREEIFGPIVAIKTFSDLEEAIELANDTEKGLASYFCTQNHALAWHMAEKLQTGIVGLNEGIVSMESIPFGGTKESGLGREGGSVGLDEYLELKYICMGGISL
mmetsp:Transcript_32137/g.42365  ORF Transcript_32137/g.42365 Transcript_32137/m.42365 type:complete len:503 (+) Transcript_32137:86-1594(+)